MRALSTEDRELIDQAIAAGKLHTIPIGESAYSNEIKWDPKCNQLRFVDKTAAKKRVGRSNGSFFSPGRRPGPPISPEVAERRFKVREKVAAGMSGADIARDLGVPVTTIYNDTHVMGIQLPKVYPSHKIGAANRAKVKAAFDGKRTIADIAVIVGVQRQSVKQHLDALGLTAPAGRAGPNKDSLRRVEVDNRRDRIRDMIAAGKNSSEICVDLGISRSVLCRDCKALRMKPVRKKYTKGTTNS